MRVGISLTLHTPPAVMSTPISACDHRMPICVPCCVVEFFKVTSASKLVLPILRAQIATLIMVLENSLVIAKRSFGSGASTMNLLKRRPLWHVQILCGACKYVGLSGTVVGSIPIYIVYGNRAVVVVVSERVLAFCACLVAT